MHKWASFVARSFSETMNRCLDADLGWYGSCVDWHSSVGATWGLAYYTRVFRDSQYTSKLAKILSATRLRSQYVAFQTNPQFEQPYGQSWFLRLVTEICLHPFHAAWLGGDARQELVRVGHLVAELLTRYLVLHCCRQQEEEEVHCEYADPYWALLALQQYAELPNTANDDRQQRHKIITIRRLTERLAPQLFCIPRGVFMDPCLNAVWLFSEMGTCTRQK
jgi:hypothetical protein